MHHAPAEMASFFTSAAMRKEQERKVYISLNFIQKLDSKLRDNGYGTKILFTKI